ncbi:hypothetical protein FQR65_LT20370 [Abscondita terminalis]|nr:hypothetical protein FQR65_LT20370 [Abscondita terminalis]
MATRIKAHEPPRFDADVISFSPGRLLDSLGALWSWGWRDAKDRQELLKAEAVEVDDQGRIDPGNSGLNEQAVRFRGWGKAMRNSYNPLMALLEAHLDHIREAHQLSPWWREMCQQAPAEYGEEQGRGTPLEESELFQAYNYQFDVWCAGYNWLQSNQQSALDVRDYIENTVLAFYRKEGDLSAAQAEKIKVILVTHSMGGLVAAP